MEEGASKIAYGQSRNGEETGNSEGYIIQPPYVWCNLRRPLESNGLTQWECGRKFKNTEENVGEEESELKKRKRNLGEHGSIWKITKLFEFSKCVNFPKSQDHLVISIFFIIFRKVENLVSSPTNSRIINISIFNTVSMFLQTDL